MSLPTFYQPSLCSSDNTCVLNQDESHHAVRVRRLKIGDQVVVLDGTGLVATGSISEANKNAVSVAVESIEYKPRSQYQPIIAVAVPKGDRQKVLVESLAQLSVEEIIPLICDFSATKFTEKLAEKWQRYAVEACKQSQNSWLPKIGDAVNVTELISRSPHRAGANIYYADALGMALNELHSNSKTIIVIGPEGGFSDKEVQTFRENQIEAVCLGSNILRTEVAAIAAAAQWQVIPQRESRLQDI